MNILEPGGSQDSRRKKHRYPPAQDAFHVLEGEAKNHFGCGAPKPRAHQPAWPQPPAQTERVGGLVRGAGGLA